MLALLLCAQVCCLPPELWLQIFRRMHRDWIAREDADKKPHLRPGGASGSEGGRVRSAAYRLHDARSELELVEDAIRMIEKVTMGDAIGVMAMAGPMRSYEEKRANLRAQIEELGDLSERERRVEMEQLQEQRRARAAAAGGGGGGSDGGEDDEYAGIDPDYATYLRWRRQIGHPVTEDDP